MKKSNFKKLNLNKKTIANLGNPEMNNVVGGGTGPTRNGIGCAGGGQTQNGKTCPGHNTCYTC